MVEALKRQAASHGRSAEAEHRAILETALAVRNSGFRIRAAALRAATEGRIVGESADLIREARDRV
jgi:antitoxin FitA